MLNNVEWMLLEHLVAITGASVTPQFAIAAFLVAVTLIAVAVVLLYVIGVLRFTPASSIRRPARVAATPRSRTVRGPVRARAPSAESEFARA